MSATDLKKILHKQIDSLQTIEDVQNLLSTVTKFVGQHRLSRSESPEMFAQLHEALRVAQTGQLTLHDEVNREAKACLSGRKRASYHSQHPRQSSGSIISTLG